MPSAAQSVLTAMARQTEELRRRRELECVGIPVAEVPRGEVPLTWAAVSPDRMVIERKVQHPSNVLRNHLVVTFHRDQYVDCAFCRRDRWLRRERTDSVDTMRRSQNYWCNTCQATGWEIEPWEVLRARLGLTTWKERIAALAPDVLIKAVAGDNPEGFPRDLLLEDAAARFAAGTDG